MLHLGVDIDPMQYVRSSLIYCYGMYDLINDKFYSSAGTDQFTGVV